MSKAFQYTVLKYRPSYLLDERVNIGLLFYFEEDGKFFFCNPSKLKRVSQFFPHLTKLNELRRYLKAFERKAQKLSKQPQDFGGNLERIVEQEFLVKNANSFFFSEVKFGFSESPAQVIIDHYSSEYFKFYDTTRLKERHDDAFVKNRFESLLKASAQSKGVQTHHFRKGVVLENKIGQTEFDFGWQNGTSNLVKTLGFDLADDHYIQEKAFRWFGAVTHLKDFAHEKDLRFDFLVAPPTQSALFKAYGNALEVLESIEANKKIVEERALPRYVEEALDTVRPFEAV